MVGKRRRRILYNKYLFLFDTDANNLNIKANTSLKELNTWSEINKLTLNSEKTCCYSHLQKLYKVGA